MDATLILTAIAMLVAGLYEADKRRKQKDEDERARRSMEECVKCAQLAGFRYEEYFESAYLSRPNYVLRGPGRDPLTLSVSMEGWRAWNTLNPAYFDKCGTSASVSKFKELIKDYEHLQVIAQVLRYMGITDPSEVKRVGRIMDEREKLLTQEIKARKNERSRPSLELHR